MLKETTSLIEKQIEKEDTVWYVKSAPVDFGKDVCLSKIYPGSEDFGECVVFCDTFDSAQNLSSKAKAACSLLSPLLINEVLVSEACKITRQFQLPKFIVVEASLEECKKLYGVPV
jgi:hypothetical protein